MAYNDFINENIAPYLASKIGVYDSSGNRVGKIELGDFKPQYGERLYRFGILSDVHRESSQTSENAEDMQRAFALFNEKESVEFTVICGDISQNGTAAEFALYKNSVDTYSANTPVYTTVGNHDATSSGLNLTNWNTYTGNHGRVFEITAHGDHFLFFGMNKWQFTTETYTQEDITWLNEKLEAYKNERCFVITHMFFPTYAGNFKNIYPSGNWLSGSMLNSVKPLIDGYPNSIWFSGHSHWKWYLQKYQDNANIYRPENGGWAVHIPSCASPIDSDGVSTRVSKPLESEGAIIDVYENYIDIRGIDLKNSKYLPIAQYRLDTTVAEVFEPDAWRVVNTSGGTLPSVDWDANTHTLTATFTGRSQKIVCTTFTSPAEIIFDSVEYSKELSDSAKEYIGFYEGAKYSITSGKVYSPYQISTIELGTITVLQFNSSSKFEANGGSYPITITIRGLRFRPVE